MFFLLPIGVDGLQVRIPVVCVGLLLLNLLAFFGTWVLPDNVGSVGGPQLRQLVDELEAHPYLEVPRSFGDKYLTELDRRGLMMRRTRWLETHAAPGVDDLAKEQAALDSRFDVLLQGLERAPMRRYALVPARGFGQLGWLSHMFLHFGWLHLLGNMLFLYCCGPLLEDTWGRLRFGVFYVVGGLIAAFAQYLIDRHSTISMAGASGAIAACMGAFAVRFARRKVLIAYLFFLLLKIFRGVWRWPAWFCGVLWFGNELLNAISTRGGTGGGVAVMAHVGGFGFGAALALGMKAVGLEKAFIPSMEASEEPLTVSLLADVEKAHALLQSGDRDGARALFTSALAAHPDDLDAAFGLVKLDFEAQDEAAALARLDPLFSKLMRNHGDERVLSLLWQIWPLVKVDKLRPGFAFALARVADAAGPQGEGLAAVLFARGGAAEGLVGAKSLLRAAELAMKTTEPHLAAGYLDALLARPDVGPELREPAMAMRAKVPAAPVAAAVMVSGLELARDSNPTGFAAPRPTPRVVSCVLLSVSNDALTLQSSTGDKNELPMAKVLAVAAGLVPVVTPGAPNRGMLLVDLILNWGDLTQAAVSIRLNSDSTQMSKLFPGPDAATVYGAFFTHLLLGSGATALVSADDLKRGKFPRYATSEARDEAVFAIG